MLLRQIESMNKRAISRFYSSRALTNKSARAIREEFLTYFTRDLNHKYVRSSPVLPLCDPTVPFVNAGMNQFKGVFLGQHDPPALRVANSQKCIRVGGKHNDLDVVGQDTYHHTFFEMLGNWSFGDYFKASACEYAWNLLTGPYGINKDYLYVTYFAGDEKLGLKPDLECKDIWLRLGIPADRVLPFGMQDNFWEMGVTGPCGPCTEIHVDHTKQSINQAARVNKGHADLTELWNIVFIGYQRLAEGPIVPLPTQHVDTGMGFERLVAILQGKRSNYDTDLFQPLFGAIQKSSNAPEYQGRFADADKSGVDSGYRVLADHARMVTVALADGMLPEQNYKLRRVLRNAIDVGEKVFRKNGLLHELSFHVAESLGDTYPELHKNLKQVQQVIEYEKELLMSLKNVAGEEWKKIVKTRPALSIVSDTTAPGLVAAYKDLHSSVSNVHDKSTTILPADKAFKLYDTYGLNPDTIAELAKVESLLFDKELFNQELNNARQRSKIGMGTPDKDIISQTSLDLLERNKVPKTDDSIKYTYISGTKEYQFSAVKCKLLGMVSNGRLLSETQPQAVDDCQAVLEATITHSGNMVEVDAIVDANSEVGIIMDRTPFYAPEGGQDSDKGHIQIKNLILDVKEVRKIRNYVIHIGKFIVQDGTKPESELRVGDECIAAIDVKTRMGIMRHHTATHLLNASLQKVLPATGQRGSTVCKDHLDLQFSVFGVKLKPGHIVTIEDLVNRSIDADVPVKTRTTDVLGLFAEENVTLVPGEIYPSTGIRIVEISTDDLISKEACCGTHVYSTGALEHFCILKVKSQGMASRSIKAVVGPLARLTRLAGDNAKQKIMQLEKDFEEGNIQIHVLESRIQDIKRQLMDKTDKILLPYSTMQQCIATLDNLSKAIRSKERGLVKETLEAEMRNVVHSSTLPFVVHCLQPNSVALETVSLQKVTKLCPATPVLVIAHSNGVVKARCCVPKDMLSPAFCAQSWMEVVLRVFKAKGGPPTGQDSSLVCHMKIKKVPNVQLTSLVEKAIIEATKFATLHVKESKHLSK